MSGGFNTINKYKQMNQELGITSAQNAIDSANIAANQGLNLNQSIFTANSRLTPGESNIYDSKIKMTSAQKWAIAGTALAGIAEIAASFAKSSATSNLFGKSKSSSGATESAAPSSETMKPTNNLEKAVAKHSKKSNDKSTANLNNELDAAKADRLTFANIYKAEDAKIADAESKKDGLKTELTELENAKNEQQTVVDKLIDGLKEAAQEEIEALDKDDKTRNGIIKDSKVAINDAKQECSATVNAQKAIISQNQKMASSTATPITNENGLTIGWNPSQQQINAAKTAITNAEKAIKAAETSRDEKIKVEEEKQEEANKKIQENLAARTIAKAQLENPSSQELVAAKIENEKCDTTVKTKEAEIKANTDEITTATTKKTEAGNQMTAIDKQISAAEQILKTSAEKSTEEKA